MAKNSKQKQQEYDEKRAASRAYNWALVVYPEDLPEDWLERLKAVTPGFCSPPHDRDVNPDGADKKRHCHVLLCFKSKQSYAAVVAMLKGLFGEKGASIVGVANPEVCRNVTGTVRYMVHADNPEKAQYEREEIIAWGGKQVDRVWGDDVTLIRGYLVSIEELIEERGIVEMSDLTSVLRQEERWELYDVVTRRCTNFITILLASRRHRAERKEEGHHERATESMIKLVEFPPSIPCDPTTGEVIGELPSEVLSRDSTLEDSPGGDGLRAALDSTEETT